MIVPKVAQRVSFISKAIDMCMHFVWHVKKGILQPIRIGLVI